MSEHGIMVTMSGSVDWFHPTSRAGSARLVMVGAFVGALVLLGCAFTTGWPVTGLLSRSPEQIATSADIGTCVTWSKPDASDLQETDCASQHLFEVTGTADISAQYPAGAPMPNRAAWLKATMTACSANATSYLGKLDPYGKYVPTALRPDATLWNSGDRSLRCGLQSSAPDGAPLASSGSAKGQDQSALYPAGTCLALNGKAPGPPTTCTQTHSYEIVGSVDLHGKFPNGFPSANDQQTALGELCQPVASAYTGNVDLTKYGLTLTWNPIRQVSWDSGSYQTNCQIGVVLQDGSGLGPLTNSIKGVGRPAGH